MSGCGRYPAFEFLEGVSHLLQGKGSGDVEIDGAGGDQVGNLGEHLRGRRVSGAVEGPVIAHRALVRPSGASFSTRYRPATNVCQLPLTVRRSTPRRAANSRKVWLCGLIQKRLSCQRWAHGIGAAADDPGLSSMPEWTNRWVAAHGDDAASRKCLVRLTPDQQSLLASYGTCGRAVSRSVWMLFCPGAIDSGPNS